MVAIPAWMWRFGALVRALIAGIAVGVVLCLLALFGSNNWLAGVVALVVITLFYGVMMRRRMNKYWPGAKDLSGPDRGAVVRATRAGHDIGNARLASAVVEYSRGLHEAAERRWWRWLIVLVGIVALVVAILDTIFGPVREAVVSWLYFVFFPIEAFWWPRRQAQLLENAERAEESARQLVAE
jgi:hypothetical protein